MLCNKCGRENIEGNKFCVGCGNSFENITMQQPTQQPMQNYQQVQNNYQQPIDQPVYTQAQSVEPNINNYQAVHSQPTVNTNQMNNNKPKTSINILGFFFFILAVILKPFTALKEELDKYNDFKKAGILSLIVSGVATIISLFKTMISSIIVKQYNWQTFKQETTLVWANLKEVEYFKVIFQNLGIYLGVIIAFAGIYYLASLIAKKKVNFPKLLTISTVGIVPFVICSLLLAPILSLIWDKLGLVINVIGIIYSFLIIYENINNELSLEGNLKYYINLACLSILIVAGYYLLINILIESAIGSITGNLGNLFG